MKMEKVDRRVRKTKARLTEVLLTLMKEKEVKDISVKELSDLADINRGTFYLHYRDVYDMLDSVEDELFCQFSEILNRDFTAIQEDSLYSVLEDVFSFLYENMPGRPGAHGRPWRSGFHQPYEGSGQGTYSPGMEPEQPTLTGL